MLHFPFLLSVSLSLLLCEARAFFTVQINLSSFRPLQRLHTTHSQQIFTAAVPTALMCTDIVSWVILDNTYESLRNYSIYLSQTKGRAGDRLQLEELTRGSMSLHGSYKRSAVVLLTRRQLECMGFMLFCWCVIILEVMWTLFWLDLCLTISSPHCLLHTHTHTHKCIKSPALCVYKMPGCCRGNQDTFVHRAPPSLLSPAVKKKSKTV